VGQGVPTQWALMLARPELAEADVSSLRVASTGAARVPSPLVAAMRERFGVPVVVRLHLDRIVTGDGHHAVVVGRRRWRRRSARPFRASRSGLSDDDGTPVEVGTVGRVLLRSEAAIARVSGAWARTRGGPLDDLIDAEATAAVLSDDGWVTMGDFGVLDHPRAIYDCPAGPRALHPGRIQRVPGRSRRGSGDPSCGRAGGRDRAPDPVLGEIGVAIVVRSRRVRTWTSPGCGRSAQRNSRTTRPPDALVCSSMKYR